MTGYLYRGSPDLELANAQIMEWRALGALPRWQGRRDFERCPVITRNGNACYRPRGHGGKHWGQRKDRKVGR